jgi:hypothetical protein
MATEPNVRSALPHPPHGIPAYFMASAFDGLTLSSPDQPKSHVLELYEQLSPTFFASIPAETSAEELEALERLYTIRLETEREERRMHFGAFALVSLLFFILLPQLVAMEMTNIGLDLLALLLMVLIVPYVFVYFGYENRVRAMAIGAMRLAEARNIRAQRR